MDSTGESGNGEYESEGFFFRGQYDYDQKYFASLSFRRDASSRFDPDHRWGSFFSVDGMGKAVLLKGIQENWVTLVQGGALVVAIAFIVVNIIVDMLYLLINPRIRSV